MAFRVAHTRVNLVADDPAVESAGGVNPSHWNADHTIEGLDDLATNVRGSTVISNSAATYNMTAEESLCNNVLFSSSYVGAVTVNYFESSNNPSEIVFCNYSVYPVTLNIAGNSLAVPSGALLCIAYAFGVGAKIAGTTWGNIWGSITDQADLYAALPKTVNVSVDFGASFTDKAQTVVTGKSWVTGSSCIIPQVLTPAGVDPDEMYLLGIRAEISDIVAGDGFTVTLYSESEAKGIYSVMCLGV
jgi:hypothetical protein